MWISIKTSSKEAVSVNMLWYFVLWAHTPIIRPSLRMFNSCRTAVCFRFVFLLSYTLSRGVPVGMHSSSGEFMCSVVSLVGSSYRMCHSGRKNPKHHSAETHTDLDEEKHFPSSLLVWICWWGFLQRCLCHHHHLQPFDKIMLRNNNASVVHGTNLAGKSHFDSITNFCVS